ncbi:hypothetical protein C8F01DRAFT_1229256 [Mycena amicta]|nr:hypothetical protein C8F01DRAFT_1229256 [Mycena amicta]
MVEGNPAMPFRSSQNHGSRVGKLSHPASDHHNGLGSCCQSVQRRQRPNCAPDALPAATSNNGRVKLAVVGQARQRSISACAASDACSQPSQGTLCQTKAVLVSWPALLSGRENWEWPEACERINLGTPDLKQHHEKEALVPDEISKAEFMASISDTRRNFTLDDKNLVVELFAPELREAWLWDVAADDKENLSQLSSLQITNRSVPKITQRHCRVLLAVASNSRLTARDGSDNPTISIDATGTLARRYIRGNGEGGSRVRGLRRGPGRVATAISVVQGLNNGGDTLERHRSPDKGSELLGKEGP